MSLWTEADLTNACQDYVVSNTPLFLLRRLKEDSAVQWISRRFTAQEILSALRESLKANPKEILDEVRPYAFLVALWMKRSLLELREALELKAPHWDWFGYIGAYLLETTSPVSIQETAQNEKPQDSFAESRSELPPDLIVFNS